MKDESDIINIKQVSKAKPKKKATRRILKILISLIIILLSAVVAINYLIPGLIMTRDLGIRYTIEDYNSALKKLEYFKDATPTGQSSDDYRYIYGKLTDINIHLSSEEITAFINTDRPDYFALKKAQVKINSDGSIEATAAVNVDYFLNEVLNGKYSREEIVKNIPTLGILPGFVNLYIHLDGSIENNKSNINIRSASVQGISIPSKYINSTEAVKVITESINSFIDKGNKKSGTLIEKLDTDNSQLVLKGALPSSLTRQEIK